MNSRAAFAVTALLLVAPWAKAQPWSHCLSHETAVFSCSFGTKVASICGVSERGSSGRFLQYRFGPLGHTELVLPSSETPGSAKALVYTNPAGEGEGYIRFSKGNYSYTAYHFSSRETGYPKQSAPGWIHWQGLLVERAGKTVTLRKCRSSDVADFEPSRIYGFWGLAPPEDTAFTQDPTLRKLEATAIR